MGQCSRRRTRSVMLALMVKHLAIVICLGVLSLSLVSCTKCGWLWDQGPRSCRSDAPRSTTSQGPPFRRPIAVEPVAGPAAGRHFFSTAGEQKHEALESG